MKIKLIIYIFPSLISLPLLAVDDAKNAGTCQDIISGLQAASTTDQDKTKPQAKRAEFKIIPSPRVPQDAEKYRAYVDELMRTNGVLDKLGIKMTGQVVEFLQPRDLNALTSGSAGGYPVSHYLDGAAVLKSLAPKGRGFALEVVYPGPIYQHGFYRDDNPFSQQISIIDHVIGHNHFAFTSGLAGYRYGQGMEATRELDTTLRAAYEYESKDVVQRYYLWALTMANLLDWYAPLLESSVEFLPQVKNQRDLLGRHQEPVRHPGRVTENLLPAFAANLAHNEPGWKKQILEHIFTSMSFRPPLVHTQIMNEGWASIMQEILPKYSENNHNFNYWLDASRVMQTEKMPDLSDPYSLGVTCWRRLREKFRDRPEIKELKTELEKDYAFIQYASDVIATKTDESFLRYAIDQTFVDRYKLAVVQTAPYEEWKQLPQPDDPEENYQWKITSKQASRVAQMIIDKVLRPKYMYNPRVKLVDFNRPSSGEVELILDDNFGRTFPLQQNYLGPSLYAMANIIGKPVSLVCTLAAGHFSEQWFWDTHAMEWKYVKESQTSFRARVVVAPNGDLKVYRINDKNVDKEISILPASQRALSEEFDPVTTKTLLAYLGAYIEDLYLEDDKELERIFNGSAALRSLVKQQVTSTMVESAPYDGLISQAPNSAGAIIEYNSMIDRRLYKALERAMRLKGGIVTGPGGSTVRVKALPSVVNIQFDHEYIQKYKKDMSAKKPSVMAMNRTFEIASNSVVQNPLNPDEGDNGTVVGPIVGEDGEHFWGPNPNGGEGQPGNQPGEDEEDLSWVDLPEGLYEKFLGEQVKLPKLNRKPGQSRMQATRAGGSVRRRNGQLLPDEILYNAFKRGIGSVAGDGDDPFDDLSETLNAGFDQLQPRDIVVKSKVPTKKPDIKAVVTFVLDASGSTAQYMEAFKRFVYDVETLVRANYKGFDFRYVIFDTEAHVMKNKNDFFRAQLGGGTKYSSGIKKVKELFDGSYARSQWDRYTFLLGDMEDFSPEDAFSDIKDLLENSEFFGAVGGLHGGGQWAELHNKLRVEAEVNESLGYTVIDEDGGYRIENIKEVLKNQED